MTQIFRGIGVSPGVGMGPAYLIRDEARETGEAGAVADETEAFDRARDISISELQGIARRLRENGNLDEAGIMDAQAMMLEDPGFVDMVREAIASGSGAADAVQGATAHFASMFEALEDEYMAGRAADVRDAGSRLRGHLLGVERPSLTSPSVVVARELTPSQTAELERDLILGFAVDTGGPTSHTAILARSLQIPAVVGLGDVAGRVGPDQEVLVDGESGTIIVEPDAAQKAEYALRRQAFETARRAQAVLRDLPAETVDGHRVTLAANIGSLDDLPAALEVGAEGVGLFRTEFLFAGRPDVPSEEEQTDAYRTVLEAMAPHAVVIRTLDVGGDKPLPSIPHEPEANPFLGLRGIRFTLAHPGLFKTQLRALLRASLAGNLAIMLPMISSLEEIEATQALLAEARAEVGGAVELGIMVEIPAAAVLAKELARSVAFFSVGSNDLIQYTLAVDRTNPRASQLYQPLHPAVLRLLDTTARGAHSAARWVGMCGEMAGDLEAIPILLGLGFDELSMTPSRIPAARERIRALKLPLCRDLAHRAIEAEATEAVERLVREQAGG